MLNCDMKRYLKNKLLIIAGIFIALNSALSSADSLDKIISTGKQTAVSSAKAQKTIDRLAAQTSDMSSEYEATLLTTDQLRDYNKILEDFIVRQEQEMVSIEKQMKGIDATERSVLPLMNEMIASLRQFILLDLPFRQEERLEKVIELEQILNRADVSQAEKYRKILLAYQTELEYGEKFVSYQDTMQLDNIETQVDFLHVGRILLVFLTLDGKHAGYYDPEIGGFQPLGDEYIKSIKAGIRMANGLATRELIKLPVPAAEESR